jgi:hypothetical protein
MVVTEAAKDRPDIRVILTSAYSQETIAGAMSPPQIRSFVRKPFQLGDLLKTLRSPVTVPGKNGSITANGQVRCSVRLVDYSCWTASDFIFSFDLYLRALPNHQGCQDLGGRP